MPCLSTFCCGYSLRSGGSFIGYVSILFYGILLAITVIVLWCIKLRIDDAGIERGSAFQRFILARANDNEIEETVRELKIFSIFFLLYSLFLLLGVLCSSFLITGSRLRKPGYLLWWLIYQILFIITSAGIVAIFVSIREERYGLTSYFKNYFFKVLVLTFILVNLAYIMLLIYFWISVLSLHGTLKREKSKRNGSTALIVDGSSVGNLASNEGDDGGSNETPSNSSAIQMIPLNIGSESVRGTKDNGKIFIIRV